MQYKAAIFDLDGTLVDSLVDLAESANTMLEHYNYPTHPVDSYRMMVGDGSKKLIERCMPPGIDEYRINAGLAYYKKIYEGRFLEKTRSYQGVLDLLKELRSEEIPLAVCTNKHKEAAHMIVGILFEENTFSEVIGDEPGLPRKPDPGKVLAIASRMDIRPEEIAYVGDSGVDMQTAVNAGMLPVGVLWGFRDQAELEANGAELLLEHPLELLEKLDFVKCQQSLQA